MDYNAIETQGTEITAEKEVKKMKISKGLKKAGKIVLAGVTLVGAFVLGEKVGSNKSSKSDIEYVEFDPEIDTVESDVNE